MSDDLVKHLRSSKGWPTLGNAAADRIEELEKERDRYLRHLTAGAKGLNEYKARIEELEAKLALAKEMYETSMLTAGGSPEAWKTYVKARDTFAAAITETPHD